VVRRGGKMQKIELPPPATARVDDYLADWAERGTWPGCELPVELSGLNVHFRKT
jgi:hypothetical protein